MEETKPSATSNCHTDGEPDTVEVQFTELCQVFFSPSDVFLVVICSFFSAHITCTFIQVISFT